MIYREDIQHILDGYDREHITIATIGSHTALQILKGARDEGFKNLVICKKGTEDVYRQFGLADELLTVGNFKQVLEKGFQEQLIERNAVLIPHGSFVEYLSPIRIENELFVPMFGNRAVLNWESDRGKEREWLERAELRLPVEFKDPADIDRLVMVKFPGAKGGRGYILASDPDEFEQKHKKLELRDKDEFTIQEYVIGTRFYPHYFYSPLTDRLELLSMDIRYESNIDGISRLSYILQDRHPEPSFVVTGNLPVVVRESLLPRVLEMGRKVIETSQELFSPGLIGPFCIETICTEDLEFIAFEISARIVAGTNLYINGSPYSQLLYDEPMSTGRRISREIKSALKEDSLDRVVY
ncbi:5-formaminoimidazole-4-carboxamide-1-(beta)-D-ribofuranosyl 5'-monophosphate synthetase [ANME-1 cluster archaeon GoMg4]|nr:5-formaminoimidazole-4-carboxamide-1-(beta)-D-ribofuranosyl 5'-monophosphate synthetase [ANME-1 cluster archaeon GoMg4]